MKIAKVEAPRCDGSWRPWTFVRMETDGEPIAWEESGRLGQAHDQGDRREAQGWGRRGRAGSRVPARRSWTPRSIMMQR
jgi:hypothetical protein